MTRTTLPFLALLLITTAVLPACGGSTSGDNDNDLSPSDLFLALDPVVMRSGTISNSGFVGKGTDLAIGDSDQNESARGIYAFDLSSIDPQRIISVALVSHQFNQAGTPYADLGSVMHVERINIGSALDTDDFDVAGTALGTLVGPGRVALDVTDAIKAIGFGRTNVEFRIQFATLTDGSGDNDFVNLTDPLNQVGSPYAPGLHFLLRK